MIDNGSFLIFADYFQFYLWDKNSNPLAPEEYSDDDVRRRVNTGANVVAIQPVRENEVPVEIEIHEADPGFTENQWDHVVECSLELPTGQLQVHECTGGPIADFSIDPGSYRIRALFGHLGELSDDQLDGNDHYKITLWPAPFDGVQVIKQWTG